MKCVRTIALASTWTWIGCAATRESPLRSQKVFLLPEAERRHLGPLFEAFDKLGIEEADIPRAMSWESARQSHEYDLVWSYEYTEFDDLGPLSPRHKVNHIPGSYALVTKGQVYETQVRLQQIYGKEHFDFIPQQYRLPEERDRFLAAFEATDKAPRDLTRTDPDYGRRWLIKNQDHRGVHFFSGLNQLHKYMSTHSMVAQCIEPLLISGHKFDIGLYVTISSIDPLRVYIYDNALLRMCKLKYPATLDDSADLESYVVDDYLPPWEMEALKSFYKELPTEDSEGTSHFSVLKEYLNSVGIDADKFQRELYGSVVKLIAGNRGHFVRVESSMRRKTNQPGRNNFFEMYRFDFLVDDKGKPWLMEVNQSPNLAPKRFKSGTDAKMKRNIVQNLLELIGIQSPAQEAQSKNVAPASPTYCKKHCHDPAGIEDNACWRCPGWFSAEEATILLESTTEYDRRGNYQLVFPSVNSEHVRFLDGGMSPHDNAFVRYLRSGAHSKAILDSRSMPTLKCSTRSDCHSQGDCVNGHCVCDEDFQGVFCEELKEATLTLSKAKSVHSKSVHAQLVDKINSLQSGNLRVIGAATPAETDNLTIGILLLGNTVVLGAVYFLASVIYRKKATLKKH